MPIILVVDDSEIDRKLVEGLLKPQIDWIVQFASDGDEALTMIAEIFPDVVVTDLQMPNMDGIRLCQEAKKASPHVPIILMTGKGSEDLAAEALSAGAASYVPKSALATSLLDTVEQVLLMASRSTSLDRLMKSNALARYRFDLENDPTLIAPMTDFVKMTMESVELGDQTAQRHCALAMEEALINAMFHGNLELDAVEVQSARKAMHEGRTTPEVSQRSQLDPYSDRKVHIDIEFKAKAVTMLIRDQGRGFDAVGGLATANQISQLSDEGGRGLTLIRKFMDEVQFNGDGNEIKLQLKLSSCPVPAPKMRTERMIRQTR
jgi:CheY-like chemotaxis protein/anti-sigma regulatory factor (Ser/Thr protein kinase)